MGGDSLLWADPDEERPEPPESEAHGGVDETFATRRLRRWLKGMFGGRAEGDPEVPSANSSESAS